MLSGIAEQRERQLFIGQCLIEEKIFNLSGSKELIFYILRFMNYMW